MILRHRISRSRPMIEIFIGKNNKLKNFHPHINKNVGSMKVDLDFFSVNA
jgi:hypothetical protein